MKKLSLFCAWADNTRLLFLGNVKCRQMSFPCHTAKAVLLCILGLLTVLHTPVRAQGPADSGSAADLGQAIQAPLLDASHAMRAHRQVQTWLIEGSSNVQAAEPVRVTGLAGVRVTLRYRGFEVGRGQAVREDLSSVTDQPGPAADLMSLLAKATTKAMLGVEQSLADTQLRAVLEGRASVGNDKPSIAKLSTGILVELELAYGVTSVRLPADASEGKVYTRFAPGYHGLAVENDQGGGVSWVWPGEAIARNIQPTSQLLLGLRRAGYERDLLPRLAKPDGPGLLRFDTFHVVRPAIDLDPLLLVRGKSDLPRYAVSEEALVGLSDRLMEHLAGRFTLRDRVLGTYQPTSGRYDPPFANDDLTALTCYAVIHHVRYLAQARPNDTATMAYAQRALNLANDLGARLAQEGKQAKPQTAALVLLSLLESQTADVDKVLRDRLSELLVDRVQDEAVTEQGGRVNAAEALVLASLATYFQQTRDPQVGLAVAQLQDRAWRAERSPDLAALPWLILAHERVSGLELTSDKAGEKALTELRQRNTAGMINLLCKRQIIEPPDLGPKDVLGAFVLNPLPPGAAGADGVAQGPPSPDWHNAQPLILLAVALRDDQITAGQDKLGWMLSAGLSARFIGQLMMDETSCYYVKDPDAALGAVRMAPWDNRLAPAPSAMSLIALTELQTTLASLRPEMQPAGTDGADATP